MDTAGLALALLLVDIVTTCLALFIYQAYAKIQRRATTQEYQLLTTKAKLTQKTQEAQRLASRVRRLASALKKRSRKKDYQGALDYLESDQGEWYVNLILERELQQLLEHHTHNQHRRDEEDSAEETESLEEDPLDVETLLDDESSSETSSSGESDDLSESDGNPEADSDDDEESGDDPEDDEESGDDPEGKSEEDDNPYDLDDYLNDASESRPKEDAGDDPDDPYELEVERNDAGRPEEDAVPEATDA